MTHYAKDARGWLTGPVDDDTPGSVPIPPPAVAAQEPTAGEPWPIWCRFEWRAEPYAPQPVPAEVEMWRCRCILIQAGKLDAVQAAIAAIADATQRALVQAEFEFRPTVRRDSALTEQLRQAAGITPTEADAMFTAAAAL